MSRHRRRQAYRRRRARASRILRAPGVVHRADMFTTDGEHVQAFIAIRPGFALGDKPRNSAEAQQLLRLMQIEIERP